MSRQFLPIVTIQLLITCVLCAHLFSNTEPESATECSKLPQEKIKEFQKRLQKAYPFLIDQPFASNMRTILRNLRRKRMQNRRGREVIEDLPTTDLESSTKSEFKPAKIGRDTAQGKVYKFHRRSNHRDDDEYDDEDNEDEYPPSKPTEEEVEPQSIENTTPVAEDNALVHKALYQNIVSSVVKEDLSCTIDGYWSSFAGGMLINIKRVRRTLHVRLYPKTPPSKKGFLQSCGWHFKGRLPFYPKNNIIVLTGSNEKDRHIASFIGECRICNGGDTVTGNWLLGRASRDCREQRASEELISDVWKRDMLTSLKNQHTHKCRPLHKEQDDDDFDEEEF